MSIRKLFAIFVALAVLFAPGFTGSAMAAPPDHQMQMMKAGLCQMPPSGSADQDKSAGKSCCVSMCMAVAVAPSAPATDEMAPAALAQFTAPTFRVSSPGELPTPPPRPS